MKHFVLRTVIGATLLATGMHAATINQRRGYQQDRIAQGVASGQLTARETAHLERQEAAVNREIRHDRADGNFPRGSGRASSVGRT